MRAFHRALSLQKGLTLVEILVTLAILALLFALLIRPMASALDIVNLGSARSEVDATARFVLRQLTEELSQALYVRSNFGYLDPITGERRAPQVSRLDVVLPEDVLESGLLRTPLMPEVNATTGQPILVTYLVTLRDPFKLRSGAYVGHDPIENPYVLYRVQYPLGQGWPDPELLNPEDNRLDPVAVASNPNDPYRWTLRYRDPAGPSQGPITPSFDVFGPASVSAVTTRESDVVEALFLPKQVRNETLQAGEHYTRFSARQGGWVRPYQVGGLWLMPGLDLSNPNQPVFPLVLYRETPQGKQPLYYLNVNNDPNTNPNLIPGSTVGHVMVYRASDRQAIYDTTLYPLRALVQGDSLFAEFACGIDWERGEILTAFENLNPRTGLPYDSFPATGDTRYALQLDANLLPEASIIPGSVQVAVRQNLGGQPATKTYRVLETQGTTFLQPGLGECHVNLDPDPNGRFVLTFSFSPASQLPPNDPNWDPWNPPAPGAQIVVRYRYRTHRPTFANPVPDVWTANYWTRNEITVHLTLDLPTNSQAPRRERQRAQLRTVVQIRNAQRRLD